MIAFRFRLCLFELLATPFELVNIPAKFQCYIDKKLREHLNIDITVYVGNILIYTTGIRDEY